jgi:hypothetical protein
MTGFTISLMAITTALGSLIIIRQLRFKMVEAKAIVRR